MVTKLVVAHRGDQTRAHENTLDAFEAAVACGADMIEFDVRQTSDGWMVVHHDDCIGDRPLSDIVLSEAADAASKLGYRLPLFRDVLRTLGGRIRLDVELKEAGYEELVLHDVLRYCRPGEVCITSFLPEAIARIRTLNRDVHVGLLVEHSNALEALNLFQKTGADFLAPEYAMLGALLGVMAARSKVPVLPWVVNEPADIARCFA